MSDTDAPVREGDKAGLLYRALMGSLHYPTRWAGATMEGAEHIPSHGPALVCGNHGPWGLDAIWALRLLHKHTGRMSYGVLDPIWLTNKGTREFARRMGLLKASGAVVERTLRQGKLMVNYPGGVQEAMRPPAERYRLRWQDRSGFVRVAMLAQAPLIPMACIGIDDVFFQLLHHEEMKRTSWGRAMERLYGGQYVPPVLLGPVPVRLRYMVGEPIVFEHGPEDADDKRVRMIYRERVREAIEGLLQRGLQERREEPKDWRMKLRELAQAPLERARARVQPWLVDDESPGSGEPRPRPTLVQTPPLSSEESGEDTQPVALRA